VDLLTARNKPAAWQKNCKKKKTKVEKMSVRKCGSIPTCMCLVQKKLLVGEGQFDTTRMEQEQTYDFRWVY
jgi:hypothetical protein